MEYLFHFVPSQSFTASSRPLASTHHHSRHKRQTKLAMGSEYPFCQYPDIEGAALRTRSSLSPTSKPLTNSLANGRASFQPNSDPSLVSTGKAIQKLKKQGFGGLHWHWLLLLQLLAGVKCPCFLSKRALAVSS